MNQKRLGLVILAVLIGGGTALAPFSQATPAHSAVTRSTTGSTAAAARPTVAPIGSAGVGVGRPAR